MTVVSAVVLLFLVMDPLGNIPAFLAVLKDIEPGRQRHIIVRELLIALAVLVIFLFAGRYILDVLNISEPALTTAGGIILFLIALRMIFPPPRRIVEENEDSEPFIVPLAIPLIAGPSAMSVVLLIMSQEPARWPAWLLALMVAWSISGLILYYSSVLSQYLGKRVLIALERLMGMILTAVAVQMFMQGITLFITHGTVS